MASLVTIPNTVMKSLKYCENHELWQTQSEHMLGSSADGRVGTNLQFFKKIWTEMKWSTQTRSEAALGVGVVSCLPPPGVMELTWPSGCTCLSCWEKFPERAVWAVEAFFDNWCNCRAAPGWDIGVPSPLFWGSASRASGVLTHVATWTGQGGHCLVARPLHPGTERGGILITPGLVPLRVQRVSKELPSLWSEIALWLKSKVNLQEALWWT